jgi:hypothetical protein
MSKCFGNYEFARPTLDKFRHGFRGEVERKLILVIHIIKHCANIRPAHI